MGPLLALIKDLFNRSTLQIILVSETGRQILHENFTLNTIDESKFSGTTSPSEKSKIL